MSPKTSTNLPRLPNPPPPDPPAHVHKNQISYHLIAYPKTAGTPQVISHFFTSNVNGTITEQTYYIDGSALSNGDGSSGSPFQSYGDCKTVMAAAVVATVFTVIFKTAGEYACDEADFLNGKWPIFLKPDDSLDLGDVIIMSSTGVACGTEFAHNDQDPNYTVSGSAVRFGGFNVICQRLDFNYGKFFWIKMQNGRSELVLDRCRIYTDSGYSYNWNFTPEPKSSNYSNVFSTDDGLGNVVMVECRSENVPYGAIGCDLVRNPECEGIFSDRKFDFCERAREVIGNLIFVNVRGRIRGWRVSRPERPTNNHPRPQDSSLSQPPNKLTHRHLSLNHPPKVRRPIRLPKRVVDLQEKPLPIIFTIFRQQAIMQQIPWQKVRIRPLHLPL
jgi:hypothetical protein